MLEMRETMSYEPHSPECDDDLLEFSDDVAALAPTVAPWRILAVDDDNDFQAAIAFSLKDAVLLERPVILTQACSMTEAVRILAKQPEFSIVLVDVVMETDDAGLRLVKAIREMLGHFDTRIILLTGQPGFAPIDSVMSRYDLSDYCLKSDINRRGIKNILSGSLRAYRDIAAVSFARRSLNLILETSNRLVAKRRHEEIANIVLYEITRMLSLPAEGVVCVRSQECAVVEAEQILVIGAAGRLAPLIGETASKLPDSEIAEALVRALREKRDLCTRDGQVLFFPPHLCFEHYAVYVSTGRQLQQTESELLKVFIDTAARGFGTAKLLNNLERQAFVDPLLDLANRNAMLREIQRAMDNPDAAPQNLLKIDIDNFNGINSVFGSEHAADMLIAVRDAILKVFPPPHFLARVAPDRFYVIGPSELVNFEAAEPVFAAPLSVGGNEYLVTACYALVPLASVGPSPEDVMRAINASMRVAKAKGSGSCQQYDPAFESEARRRFSLSSRLAQAIPGKEFLTLMQPQIDLASGRMIGGEVLLRWNHAGGATPPGEFIPIAEQSVLIHKIGQTVIAQTFAALAALSKAGREDLTLSINVSPREFENENFVAALLAQCEATGIPASRIELEVLESAVMIHFELIRRQLAQFRQAGGSVAIDDFGTGMSSLAYLMELPHDRIKIDRSFISRLQSGEANQRLTRMIVDLGLSLNKTVIAEGVETPAQAEWLLANGCQQAQGWLYARAMPLDEFIAFCR
jgi:EAL domain-containing protein (putative c-di-GMP-specific phosphodiesterase class I)/GGDEF domain-containing protein/CheY-like chemotaxis protein